MKRRSDYLKFRGKRERCTRKKIYAEGLHFSAFINKVFLKELPLNMQFDQGYFLSMYDAVCLQFLFTVISDFIDVAKTLFTQYISRSKNEESLTYNFFVFGGVLRNNAS